MSQKPPPFTVASYLARRLRQLGAQHLFAVPGDYVAAFIDAVDAAAGLRRVSCVNELEAAYAADGYARFRGIAAVAVTYGVGAFSALNAVAGSYVERLPVVVINGSPSHANRRLGRERDILFHHSTGNLEANMEVFRQVTVAAEVLASGAHAPVQIDRALRAAITHSRPVYIEGLKDIWEAVCAAPVDPLQPDVLASDPAQLAEAVETAWGLLSPAQHGIIWAGIELQRRLLQPRLEDFLDVSGWPFVTTLLAKSLLSEDHPQFVGVYTGPAASKEVRAAVEGSDAILALGTLITDDYLDILAIGFDQMIVAFDDRVRVGSRVFHPVTLRDFVEALQQRFAESPTTRPPLPPAARARSASSDQADAITFDEFFDRMATFIDDGMVVLADESDSMYVSSAMKIAAQNGYVAQAAWGSIGYTVAGAIGVGLGSECRPVVFVGDGGFQMTCQALSTLQREQLGAIVFVMNNGIYGIEQALIDLTPFDQPGHPNGDFRPYNILPDWDYAKLAEAFGGLGVAVTTMDELEAALETALDRKRDLTVIRVVIPMRDLPPAIRRLASDTGYPRYERPAQSAAMRLASLQARVDFIAELGGMKMGSQQPVGDHDDAQLCETRRRQKKSRKS